MTLAGETSLTRINDRARRMTRLALALTLGAGLSGCEMFEGTVLYHGPDSVIADARDTGRDAGGKIDGEAAIAYDPDGCQVWIIDDGLEGYSTPRFNPDTGLPVCDDKFPPGTVIGQYQSSSSPIPDRVPR